MSGFTYNGTHCSTYHVEYVPNPSARWWEGAEYETYKKDVTWRNGGYKYGSAVNIRTITLDCYFEEITIKQREQIRKWLGRNTSGNLIFDDMPFVYYKVSPDKIVPGKLYNDTGGTYSGTFTITFVAENPFGYLTRKSNAGTENDHAEDYCGIKASSAMPATPSTSSREFDIYNPGTEVCGLNIHITGSCMHAIRFYNQRNKTECVINSLPLGTVELRVNADTGNVTVYSAGTSGNGFAHHDRGFIRLEPDEGNSTNHIIIQELNSSGYWVVPTTLSISYLNVDYNPRLL